MKIQLILCFFFIECASPGVGPRGLLFSKTKIGIFSTGAPSSLSGRGCLHSILGLFAFGKGSISSAKKNSKIVMVTDVNWEATNYLSVYSSLCVVVHGN